MNQEIIKFLKDKNYFVDVQIDESAGTICVNYPTKNIGDLQLSAYKITYKPGKNNVAIIRDGKKYSIKCDPSIRRVVIKNDLLLRCQIIEYSQHLIDLAGINMGLNKLCKMTENDRAVEASVAAVATLGLSAQTEEDVSACQELAEETNCVDIYKSLIAIFKFGLQYDKQLIEELAI